MSTSVYDFTLAPAVGATQRISVQGNQALVRSANGTVELITDKGRRYVCDEGQGFKLPADETFRELLLINRQAVANTGFLFVGDSTYIDRRITGNVRIIDQSADKTLALNQFYGTSAKTASATRFGIAAITAVNKNCYVKRLFVTSQIAGNVYVGLGNGNPLLAGFIGNPFCNKRAGGPNSQAVRVTGESVAQGAPATPTEFASLLGPSELCVLYLAANMPQEIALTTPLCLQPGQTVFVQSAAINNAIIMAADFEEF